jgi:hypothetical protein
VAVVVVLGGLAIAASAGGQSVIPEHRLADLRDGLAGPQAEALADGSVSAVEYKQAVERTVACLRAEGVAVSDPVWEANELRFSYGGYPTREELEVANAVYARCYDQHQAVVDRAWSGQFAPAQRPDDATIAAYYGAMQECTGAAEPTFRSAVEAAAASGDPSKFAACTLAVSEELGMIPN